MSILVICAIRDRAVDAFMPPVAAVHIGQVVREFKDAVNGDGPFSKHPDDYDLYKVGEFDSSTGSIKPLEPVEMIAVGKSLVDSSS